MLRVTTLIAAALVLAACGKAGGEAGGKPGGESGNDTENPSQEQPAAVQTPGFAKGADISWTSEMEKSGKTFRKADGTTADIFDVLKDCGINSIRLRVWVNPTGGWSGKDDVAALALRAAKAGMALMIDFHYSDFFADPSRQTFPKDWEADKADAAKTAARIKAHTTEVLNTLKDKGVSPAWIQIGNETRNGFLWPLGQLWDNSGDISGGWARFVQLYNAGYDAAKAVFPQAAVMPHLNNAWEDNDWWFKKFKAQGARFDAITLSHYPQTESGKTAEQVNSSALARISALASAYGVPVYVAEVGVKPATESASAAVLKAFMDGVRAIPACKGVFYWEPEVYGGWKPAVYSTLGWGSYDMGAFSSDGRPTSIMNAFK
jgi:arabinogalactan endo-1,4-beta-galactosidase